MPKVKNPRQSQEQREILARGRKLGSILDLETFVVHQQIVEVEEAFVCRGEVMRTIITVTSFVVIKVDLCSYRCRSSRLSSALVSGSYDDTATFRML